MLNLFIPMEEGYDEEQQRFVVTGGLSFRFEHSLLSLTQWEIKYRKHFLGNKDITPEEYLDYFMMMCLDDGFKPEYFSEENVTELFKYLNDKPTATVINSKDSDKSNRFMTSELIYAFMANARVPFSCESWNLHRLFSLLGIISELNNPPKKMSQKSAIMSQAEINRKRREAMRKSKSK